MIYSSTKNIYIDDKRDIILKAIQPHNEACTSVPLMHLSYKV